MDARNFIECAASNHWVLLAGVLAILNSLLEYWLGKTEKVKSSSVLELAFSVILMVTLAIFIRRKSDGREESIGN
jgi:hypothetical protein